MCNADHNEPQPADNEVALSKRNLLRWGLAAGFIPLAGVANRVLAQTAAPRSPITLAEADDVLRSYQTCVLTPQSVEGPFYVNRKLVRRDIREDQQGEPLKIKFQVIDANGCDPVAGALVSVWQCNAFGYYSGYEHSNPDRALFRSTKVFRLPHEEARDSKTYLRGIQVADAEGRAEFQTIFPAWYTPRVPHIHVKVFLKDATEVLTTQFFFPQVLINDVLSKGIYAKRGPGLVTNENDFVRRQSQANAQFTMSYDDKGMLVGSVTIGVAHV